MNKYCEILNAIKSGELTHPIPTYKFNNFKYAVFFQIWLTLWLGHLEECYLVDV